MKSSALFVFVVAVTSMSSGQWLERQVLIGDTLGGIGYPEGIVVNPLSGNVYIETSPVQVFNPATMEKVRGINTWGMAAFSPSSGKGYLFNTDDSVIIIDGAADTVIGRKSIHFQAEVVACNPLSNRIYLGSSNDETLLVFDPNGDSVLHKVGVGGSITRLLWDSARNRLYIGVDSDSGLLKILDCTTDTLLPDVRTGVKRVYSLTLSTTSHRLYCSGADDKSWFWGVVAINTDSLESVDTVPGLPPDGGTIYSPLTDRLYVLYDDTLYVVDCRNDSIRARIVAPGGALTASSLDGRVYLAHDSAQVLVVDTTDSVVGSIRIPGTNNAEVLTFAPGRNEVYGASDGAVVFVVDASADTVTGTIDYSERTPYRMVHNPAGNKLYLFCYERNEVLVMDSTFGTWKQIHLGNTGQSPLPILDQTLNRIYAVGSYRFRVIDCNTDSVVVSRNTPGIVIPVPAFVPYLNRLYVFDGYGYYDSIFAYNGLEDRLYAIRCQTDTVRYALYDPRSNRVFFACRAAPALRALDPLTDSVVKTFSFTGGSIHGRMAINADLGRLYYTDMSPARTYTMFTIDLLADSVIASTSLPFCIDEMFLNRHLGKLYLCSKDTAKVLVYDCNRGVLLGTFEADYLRAGLMNDRNDKLYLGYGEVIDCRYDSVVTVLPPDSLDPGCMAWDAIDNRVFQAEKSRLYVYRDDPYGIAAEPMEPREQRHATIIRGVLELPGDRRPGTGDRAVLLDIAGRKVLNLRPVANDVRALVPGVYFIRGPETEDGRPAGIRKVVVTR